MRKAEYVKRDPTWLYPLHRRGTVERAYHYLEIHRGITDWHTHKHVLSCSRKNKIAWESVRPDLRPQCQEWFDNKIAEYRAKGRPITQGIINSVRCNATRHGRYILTGLYSKRTTQWYKCSWIVRKYEQWLAQQQRKEFTKSLGKTESRQLEI